MPNRLHEREETVRLPRFWLPTMLQVFADMRAGDITPSGHGHNYAPNDYIDAWLALTEPPGWTEVEVRRLKGLFAP